jgi:hypothetical protein
VQEDAIWKCRTEEGAEVSVQCGVVTRQRAEESKILFLVVADRIRVASRAQKTIHLSRVIFDPSALVGMIGLIVAAAGEVACQMVCRVNGPRLVRVTQSSLLSVRGWQPAEKVIKAAIFHHDYDDMLNAGAFR